LEIYSLLAIFNAELSAPSNLPFMNNKKLYQLREKIYKSFFLYSDYFRKFAKIISDFSDPVFFISSLLFILLLGFHIGFYQDEQYDFNIGKAYKLIFIFLFLTKNVNVIINFSRRKKFALIFDFILFIYGLNILLPGIAYQINIESDTIFSGEIPVIAISILILLSETNKFLYGINSFNIPTALLFVISFLLIIIIGSGLLMLPNARTQPITFLEALFTSTSAVCVTGLVVLDTSSAFTTTGQIIILSLIQIGALGIMTFTGFLGYVFTGSASFRERIVLKDILSSENFGSLFKVLIKIISITFLTEIIGALYIYFNSPEIVADKIFFSVFHAVSAFCNAGFSTLPAGLFTDEVQTNYNLHAAIAILIILGGIGFPVLLTFYKYLKHLLWSFIMRLQHKRKKYIRTININTNIVIVTTFALLIAGTLFYYLIEDNISFNRMSTLQKLMVSFFSSVSARTAGFNVVDITLWSYPTIFVMIFLMWVGASPSSTGGGIKTTSFAVALLTVFNFIRGRKSLEIGHREIGTGTINRVLSVIFLSLIVIFSGFMGLLIAEPSKNPVYLLFESFSAFGTVGLSIVQTATLSENSKWIIIFLMFIGRVGPLTLLTAIFIKQRKKYYKLPVQDLIIN
jgi:trk system potassium uptake protein